MSDSYDIRARWEAEIRCKDVAPFEATKALLPWCPAHLKVEAVARFS